MAPVSQNSSRWTTCQRYFVEMGQRIKASGYLKRMQTALLYTYVSLSRSRWRKPWCGRYGWWSTLTCEAYVARLFTLLMDVVSRRRLLLLLAVMAICWMFAFVRLSFVDVSWHPSPVEEFRRDIRKNMTELDSSLRFYRLIRPLNREQTFHVRSQFGVPQPHKKVLIFSYKHAGCSSLAEMFNQDSRVMLWYETLDPFYVSKFGIKPHINPHKITEYSDNTNRELVKSERKWISDYFRYIYSCQAKNMPLELIAHNFVKLGLKASQTFRTCVSMLGPQAPSLQEMIEECSAPIEKICGPTVDHSIRRQCPTILHAASSLRDIIRQMEGDLDDYQQDVNITQTLRTQFEHLSGTALRSLSSKDDIFPSFLNHQFCLAKLERTLKPCQPHIVETCSGKPVTVSHVVRLKSENLRFILREFPTIRMVFYVRDPRAIAYARVEEQAESKGTHAKGSRVVEEAEELCSRMLSDYWEMVKLQHRYPKVAFVLARYEDMILYPYELALEIYNFLGLSIPESYKLYVESHMIVNKAEYLFGASDSANHDQLHHWKTALSKSDIRELNKHCGEVLDIYQYDR